MNRAAHVRALMRGRRLRWALLAGCVLLALALAWSVSISSPSPRAGRGGEAGSEKESSVPSTAPSSEPPSKDPGRCLPSADPVDDKEQEERVRKAAWSNEFPGAQDTGSRPNLPPADLTPIVMEEGAVVKDVSFDGQVTIEADNVTLRNVTIRSGAGYGVLISGSRALLEDVTVLGGRPSATMAGIAALDEGSFIARRVDVSHVEDGVRLGDNSTLVDSYVHDLCGTASAHFDGVLAEGRRNWEIRGNTIVNAHAQTSAVAIGLQASNGIVAGNLISGGGYALYAGPATGADLTVSGNVFSTSRQPRGGQWGPVAYWERPENLWQGNVWADGQSAGMPVEP